MRCSSGVFISCPLGQKLTVARRGSGRVAAALLAGGHPRVVQVALDNSRLAEAHLLRVLADAGLSAAVLELVASHAKWSRIPNIGAALVRHPNVTAAGIAAVLPKMTAGDLHDLSKSGSLGAEVLDAVRAELERKQNG